MLNINDFKKLDLRVAKIIAVEEHPDADKLYSNSQFDTYFIRGRLDLSKNL